MYQPSDTPSAAAPLAMPLQAAALLVLLLLGALVEVAAETYFDPDLRLGAAQQFVSP